MLSPHQLRKFLGPWLAYAALSGVGGGFIFGAVVSLLEGAGGIVALGMGAYNGEFLQAVPIIAEAFPYFALSVLAAIGCGFIGGFITGLCSSLIGGKEGAWWSFLIFSGIGLIITSSGLISVSLSASAFGAALPHYLLTHQGSNREWQERLSRWMQTTWLLWVAPEARMVGLLLPVVICFALAPLWW